MILTEAKLLVEVSASCGVPYLEEYLIMSNGITVKESQNLTFLVENALTDKLSKIKSVYNGKLADLKTARHTKLMAAGKNPSKIAGIKKWYEKSVLAIKASYKTAVEAAKKAAGKATGAIKTAAGKIPKSGKIGVGVAAGVAAAGAGYAGFKAYKNRKAALAKK